VRCWRAPAADTRLEPIGEIVVLREIRIQQGHVETLALAAQKFPEGGELAGVDDGGLAFLMVGRCGDAKHNGHLVLPC
jgi:hypothetical protein